MYQQAISVVNFSLDLGALILFATLWGWLCVVAMRIVDRIRDRCPDCGKPNCLPIHGDCCPF